MITNCRGNFVSFSLPQIRPFFGRAYSLDKIFGWEKWQQDVASNGTSCPKVTKFLYTTVFESKKTITFRASSRLGFEIVQ